MAEKRVVAYAIGWDIKEKKGKIRISIKSAEEYDIVFNNAQEFSAACSILRGDHKVYYDPESQELRTGYEMTQED